MAKDPMIKRTITLKVALPDEEARRMIMKTLADLSGVDSISTDMKEETVTVTGAVDPVNVVAKLREHWHAEILRVNTRKTEEFKKEENKDEAARYLEPPPLYYKYPILGSSSYMGSPLPFPPPLDSHSYKWERANEDSQPDYSKKLEERKSGKAIVGAAAERSTEKDEKKESILSWQNTSAGSSHMANPFLPIAESHLYTRDRERNEPKMDEKKAEKALGDVRKEEDKKSMDRILFSPLIGSSNELPKLFGPPADPRFHNWVRESSDRNLFMTPDLSPYPRESLPAVTVKATHREDIVKFRIPPTFGIVQLKEEIARRWMIRRDSFNIKYVDGEGDWVSITCNSDLQDLLMDFSRLSGKYTLRLSVHDIIINHDASVEISQRNTTTHQSEIELSSEPEKLPGSKSVTTEIEKMDKMNTTTLLVPLSSTIEKSDALSSREIELPETNTVTKRSMKDTLMKILECITDATTRRVCVYGNPGTGKATMLKALITKNDATSIFDLIIFVSVSRYWNTRKIQTEIAKHLQLCLEDIDTDSQAAGILFQALKDRKFLLVLDDVWEFISFAAVGIPDPTQEISSKIIVASRSLDVCRKIGADREVAVEGLSEEEARELFHKQLGEMIYSSDIQPHARVIVQECGGSPLSIVITGKVLRGENNVQVWKDAAEEFSLSRKMGLHTTGVLLAQLKFSYDRLESEEKSFLLYCGLFPKYEVLNICRLIDYCTEEGLIVGDPWDAHRRGHDIVQVLADSALLEIDKDGVSGRMHDMI